MTWKRIALLWLGVGLLWMLVLTAAAYRGLERDTCDAECMHQ